VADEVVICRYRVKRGSEDEFIGLLRQHYPTLKRIGAVTDTPVQVYQNLDGEPTFVEIFTWAEGGYLMAREHPDVIGIWDPMDKLCEDRDGLPGMEFPHFKRLDTTD
jgi:hypothetical protein